MPRRRSTSPSPNDEPTVKKPRALNEVTLIGRVAEPPQERTLPSGDALVTARVIVERDPASRARSQQRVDTIDCVAWLSKVQRSMRTWVPGEHVEVAGAMRRRFYRADTGSVSRAEVEIRRARRVKLVDG